MAAIDPQPSRGAIATFDSRSVTRFLGHRLHENHEGEIVSDYHSCPDGGCVKHRAMRRGVSGVADLYRRELSLTPALFPKR